VSFNDIYLAFKHDKYVSLYVDVMLTLHTTSSIHHYLNKL